jgi:hypothetical protein
MNFRLADLAVVAALAAGLASCAAPQASRVATAQSAVHLGAVTTTENCPAFGDGGSGDYVRNLGSTTPWSENPFLNPCWPN